jgi:hypothetical protein
MQYDIRKMHRFYYEPVYNDKAIPEGTVTHVVQRWTELQSYFDTVVRRDALLACIPELKKRDIKLLTYVGFEISDQIPEAELYLETCANSPMGKPWIRKDTPKQRSYAVWYGSLWGDSGGTRPAGRRPPSARPASGLSQDNEPIGDILAELFEIFDGTPSGNATGDSDGNVRDQLAAIYGELQDLDYNGFNVSIGEVMWGLLSNDTTGAGPVYVDSPLFCNDASYSQDDEPIGDILASMHDGPRASKTDWAQLTAPGTTASYRASRWEARSPRPEPPGRRLTCVRFHA